MAVDHSLRIPDDKWFGDARVQACSAAEKGALIGLWMFQWKGDPQGVLRMPLERIAILVGTSVELLRGLVSVGLLCGNDGPAVAPRSSPECPEPSTSRIDSDDADVPRFELARRVHGPVWFCDWMVEAAVTTATGAGETERLPDAGGQTVGRLPNCPHARIVDLFHRTLPQANRVLLIAPNSRLSKAMKSAWRSLGAAALSEFTGYDSVEAGLQKWGRLFEYAAKSRFLTGQLPGRNGDPPFTLSLGWLVMPSSIEELLSGTYHRDATERAVAGGEPSRSAMSTRVLNGVDQVLAMQSSRHQVNGGSRVVQELFPR